MILQAIVLIEIAPSKDTKFLLLSRKANAHPGRRFTSADVARKVNQVCRNKWPHRIGHIFTQAIQTCLDFGEQTKSVNEDESQMSFQQHACVIPNKAVGNV